MQLCPGSASGDWVVTKFLDEAQLEKFVEVIMGHDVKERMVAGSSS